MIKVNKNGGDNNDEEEDDDSDDSGSSSSEAGKKPAVEGSGAPIDNPNPGLGVLSPAACSGFIASGATSPTAAAISDEEQNSWDESMSESEGSDNEYYDQEDYDDEVDVTPPPDLQQQDQQQPQEESKEETAEAPAAVVDPDQSSTDGEEETGRLVMNVYCTEYDVVQKVGRKVLGFKLKEYKEDHEGAI